ncbi:tissue factor precursor [Silurus asotus]|uniref:Tissue factor n=1 Tax=Silurus asotus TaxID=30991 RepID=A0AAD5ALV1_SILAS|nr:tissue factor precursor [Silurus asotus]
MTEKHWSFAGVWLLLCLNTAVSGSFPQAQAVTWVSYNFKTILTWRPKPVNYSYTVEFSKFGGDNQRTSHCIQMNKTECDLTVEFADLKSKYTADVLSEPLPGVSFDSPEFPRAPSDQFCPYQDTFIGSPKFKIEVSKDERKATLYIEDIPTALLDAQKKTRTIQDIFQNDLNYMVTYNKAKSSGKKVKMSASNQVELPDLDRGVSYCFTVQVQIPSRGSKNHLGELSQVQCSPGNTSFFEEYSIGVIAGCILAILVIISTLIVVIVICCNRRQKRDNEKNEGVPLKGV